MGLIDWLKGVWRGESNKTEGVDIEPGETVTTNLTNTPGTWDCPKCGTHESMTNSDTFDVNWWCTVCQYTTEEEPPFSYE